MNKEAIGTLTGKYFHSVKSDRETIEWQGKFLGLASPGLYRVQLYKQIGESESEQRLVPATDMRYWKIYDTLEQMVDAYERYVNNLKQCAGSNTIASADLVIHNGKIIKQRGQFTVVIDGVVMSGVQS